MLSQRSAGLWRSGCRFTPRRDFGDPCEAIHTRTSIHLQSCTPLPSSAPSARRNCQSASRRKYKSLIAKQLRLTGAGRAGMKAVAFSNNDIAVAAWTFGRRLQGLPRLRDLPDRCQGRNGNLSPGARDLSRSAGVPQSSHRPGPGPEVLLEGRLRQARRLLSLQDRAEGGRCRRALTPMSVGSLTTNIVQLTPDYLRHAFGLLQSRHAGDPGHPAHALHENGDLDSMKQELLRWIADESDQLRIDLAGDMIEAMTMLPKEAAKKHGKVWCALYEFEDTQIDRHPDRPRRKRQCDPVEHARQGRRRGERTTPMRPSARRRGRRSSTSSTA